MRPSRFAIAFVLACLAAACARGQSDYVGEPGSGPGVAPTSQGDAGGTGNGNGGAGSSGGASGSSGGGSSGASGSSGSSGGTSGSSGSSGNTSGGDAGADAAKQDAAPPTPDAGGLDPLLSLPDPSGAPCVPGVGSEIGCPLGSVCRLSSPGGGRCESCTNCGHLKDPCSSGSDCDIVFECYDGRCTNFCQLGSYNCGAIPDCLNVGDPTIGVCRP